MRFDGELESAYRRDQFQDRLRYLRINLAILAAISLTVIQIDRVVVPVIGRIVPDLARTGVMLPLLLLGFAITFIRRADDWYPRYIAVAMIVALTGMSWISLTAWGEGEPRVFVRLLLAIVAVYFVLGLAFRSAIAVNAIGFAAYAALAASKGMPGVEMTHYLTTLVTANIICIAGAYNLEHARRIAWLEGQRLAESRCRTASPASTTGAASTSTCSACGRRACASASRSRSCSPTSTISSPTTTVTATRPATGR